MDNLLPSALISASVLLASCNSNLTDVSVPEGRDLNGCYAGEGIDIALKDGAVIRKNAQIASFVSGRNAGGSFIRIKPAIGVRSTGVGKELIPSPEFSEEYVTTIMERGKVTILMPVEPMGLVKLVAYTC